MLNDSGDRRSVHKADPAIVLLRSPEKHILFWLPWLPDGILNGRLCALYADMHSRVRPWRKGEKA